MRLVGERREQLELLAGQVDRLAADGDDAGEPVDREVADLDAAPRRAAPSRRSTARIRASSSS